MPETLVPVKATNGTSLSRVRLAEHVNGWCKTGCVAPAAAQP